MKSAASSFTTNVFHLESMIPKPAMKTTLPSKPGTRPVLAAFTGLALAFCPPTSMAGITVSSATNVVTRTTMNTTSYNPSGASKLVVVITGEHGNPGDMTGDVTSLKFGATNMIKAVERNPGSSNQLCADIWYLDNPGSTAQTFTATTTSNGNNFVFSIFRLTGTATGHGGTAVSASPSKSVSLTTTASNSMVVASHALGGDGNTGASGAVTATSPAVKLTNINHGSNWVGQCVSTTNPVATAGPATYAFAGGSATGCVTIAAEFKADVTPPTISTLSPADDATAVPTNSNLVVTFNESIAKGTGNITIKNLTDATQTTIAVTNAQVTVAGATLTINPTADLLTTKDYAIQIDPTAVKDLADNTFAGITDDTTWNFTVPDPPPAIATLSPADNAIGVALNANLEVTFTETVAIGTGDITIKNLTDSTQSTIAVTDGTQVSVSGATLSINPTSDLLDSKNYAIQIAAGAVKDSANNDFAGIADDTTWNFASFDSVPPTLAGSNMVDDKGGAAIIQSTVVTYAVTFSEDMDHTTVTDADFGNAGTAAVTIGSVTETAPGVFSVPVTPTSIGTLRLQLLATADVKDLAGNSSLTKPVDDDTTLNVVGPIAYWDIDGTTAGAGGSAPAGIWGAVNPFWNTAADGTDSTFAWASGQTAVFAAGADATGTYSVTVDGTKDINGLTFQEGTVTLTGGTALRLVANSTVDVAAGLAATVATPVTEDVSARSLTKTSEGSLTLAGLSDTAANNFSGTTTIGQGTLAFSTTNPSLTGGLTFGTTTGSTNVGSLDLGTSSATFGGGLTVRTNSPSNNLITIGSGQTLTFTGSTLTNAVTVGTNTDSGVAMLQATGAGTLTINESTRNMVVANTAANGTASAQMDLSGLATFNATIANLYVGRPTTAAGAATGGRPSDSLTLAGTNNITVSGSLVVGAQAAVGFQGSGSLKLGTTNILNAATIVVGNGRVPGNLSFNSGLTNPSVTLRGAGGGSTRTNITLGDHLNSTGVGTGGGGSNSITGTMDFTGGTVDALIGTLTVGNGAATASNNRGKGNGVFTFGAGSSVDINTLIVGQAGNTTSASTNQPQTGAGTGTFNMNGGTLQVNTAFTIANDADTTATTNGIQNITGIFHQTDGTTTIGSIGTPVNVLMGSHLTTGNSGLATASMNLTGGTTNVFGDIKEGNLGAGTITSTLTLNGGTLDMNGYSIGVSGSLVDNMNFQSGILRNVFEINNGAGLTKTGTGTLTLTGTIDFTGGTTVNAGTLNLDYTADSNLLNDTAVLTLGGGTLNLTGGTDPEAVLSTTLAANTVSAVNRSSGSATLQMGDITANPGASVNFGADNIATTNNSNTNGILGPWATVGGSDWATNSTNAANGLIVAYSSYTDVPRLTAGTITSNPTSNVRLIEGSGSAGDIVMAAPGTTVVNTLLQSAVGGASAANVVIGNGNTLQVNTILQASSAGAMNIDISGTTAQLQTGTAGGSLGLLNYSATELKVNAIISDNTSASSLTVGGSGTVVLTAGNTYSGTTTVNSGSTLQLGDGTSGNDGTIANSLGLVNYGTLVYNRFGSTSYGGSISGTGTLTKNGVGTQMLTGANTYSGGTTISAGTLAIGTGGSLLSTGAISIANGATLDNSGSTSQTLSGAITGGGTLLLSGIGQFILSNADNAYGAVNITAAGRVFINTNATALPAAATVAVSNGGILNLSIGASYANAITLGDNGGLATRVSGGTTLSNVTLPGTGGTAIFNSDDSTTQPLTISSGQTLAGNLTVQLGGSRTNSNPIGGVTLSGILTGTGALTVTSSGQTGSAHFGTGVLTLTGANDYSGGTILNQGTLTAGTGGTLGASTGPLSVNNTNTVTSGKNVVLNLPTAVDTTVGSLSGMIATPTSGTNTATINTGGIGSYFTVNQTTDGTFAGVIAGAGNFVLGGLSTNTLTLSGSNTYTGTTTVNAGTLALGTGASISTSSSVILSAAGTLDTSAQATYAIPAAQPVSIDIDPAGSGSSGKITAAGLNITNAVVTLNPTATLDDPVYVLATYTSLTGASFAAPLPTVPAGYTLSYAYQGNKIALVKSVGFSSWITGTFAGGTTVPSGQQGPNDDPDKDGIPNLIEYAVADQDPTVASSTISTFSDGTLSFTKRPGTSGLIYAIMESTDLGQTDTWAEVTHNPPASPYVNDATTISYKLALGSLARDFIRLRVTQN